MPDWVKDIATAGPSVIFAVMWWLERSERKEIMERSITAMLETRAALAALSFVLTPRTRGGQ